jgi:flagellar basal body rod protein FlgG
VKFDKGYYDGVIDYTVNDLTPNTKYYFKVRAGNGCATGVWSGWLEAKTEGGVVTSNTTKVVSEDLEETTKLSEIEAGEKIEVSPTKAEAKPAEKNEQPMVKTPWWKKIFDYFLHSLFLPNKSSLIDRSAT